MFLFRAIAAICLPLYGNNHRDPDFPVKLFSCGFGMWALLAGVVVTANCVSGESVDGRPGKSLGTPLVNEMAIFRQNTAPDYFSALRCASSSHFGADTGVLEETCGSKSNSTLSGIGFGRFRNRNRSNAKTAASSSP